MTRWYQPSNLPDPSGPELVQAQLQVTEDNIARTVDWLLGVSSREAEEPKRDWVHVA